MTILILMLTKKGEGEVFDDILQKFLPRTYTHKVVFLRLH